MKFLMGPLVAAMLALSGCAGGDVGQLVSTGVRVANLLSSTAGSVQIGGQVTPERLYQVEAAVRVARQAAVTYRRMPMCYAGEVETIERPCARRSVLVQIANADRQIKIALGALRTYVRAGDQAGAVQTLNTVLSAVEQLRALPGQAR